MTNYDSELEAIVDSMKIPPEAREIMLNSLYENLKSRIGIRLALELKPQDIEIVMAISKETDDQAFFKKLTEAFPNFDQVMTKELNDMKTEITASDS